MARSMLLLGDMRDLDRLVAPRARRFAAARRSALFAASVTLSLAACAAPVSRTYYGAPVATARRVENLRSVAARHTACPARDIEVQSLTTQVFQTRGCGAVREFALVDRGRYAEWEPIAPVHERATNEMACPLDQLVIEAPVESARQVTGCGRNAQYQLACSQSHCEWAMTQHSGDWANTEQEPIEVMPAGPRILATPPSGSSPPVVIVPEGSTSATDRGVDRAVRDELDRRAEQLRACTPGGTPVVRARWARDGVVRLTLEAPWDGTESERCIQQSIGRLQVTTGESGELVHVLR